VEVIPLLLWESAMKIRFAVLENEKDFEVTGSYLLNDEEVKESLIDQAISRSKEGNVQFYEMDTESMTVKSVEMESQDDE
jgi:hypothetical protein